MPARPIRLLLFSTLYPSDARPGHGLFVETRLRRLIDSGAVDAKVIAPVPWFPFTDARFGAWARIAATPATASRHGIAIEHPRYLLPPRVGETVAPVALALGARATLARLIREGFNPDVIDAHYYYPDGVAAALLGGWFGKPVTITARGSDLNVLGQHALPRRMMQWAGAQAAGSIGVCQALVDVLQAWGLDPGRLQVIRNGVDLQRFKPGVPAAARSQLGVTGAPVLLCVGNLVPVKGHDLLLQAMANLRIRHPSASLYLVGDGPLRNTLQAQVLALGLAGQVHFVGTVPQDALAAWYSAADALVLPSRSEGWANVLLEAMACGTPVVATDVGGSAEVLGDAGVGLLVPRRDADSLAATLDRLLARLPDRSVVRTYAEGFSWDHTTQAQLRLFRRIVHGALDDAPRPARGPD